MMKVNNFGLGLTLVVLFLVVAVGVVSAQQADGLDRDIAISIPSTMTVDAVDPQTGEVVLDGESYLFYSGKDRQSQILLDSVQSDPLSLAALKSGMQVLVQTDGSLPSDQNKPLILGIWKGD